MREDPWLAERLGRLAITVEADDAPALAVAAPAFLQTRVPADDVLRVAALERAGWSVVDVTVTLQREPDPAAGADSWDVGLAREDERGPLLDIAAGDYDVSRFHRDPAIPDAVARRIKRDWLAACLEGTRGDGVLVARNADGPAGFLAITRTARASVIDLIAVRSAARGAGAGRALVRRLLAESPDAIRVGTQIANVAALAFYEALGFRASDSRYVLHRHV